MVSHGFEGDFGVLHGVSWVFKARRVESQVPKSDFKVISSSLR